MNDYTCCNCRYSKVPIGSIDLERYHSSPAWQHDVHFPFSPSTTRILYYVVMDPVMNYVTALLGINSSGNNNTIYRPMRWYDMYKYMYLTLPLALSLPSLPANMMMVDHTPSRR